MSRFRLSARLRQNDDYLAIVEYLKMTGLQWRLCGPTGSSHPFIEIELPSGKSIRHTISSTPRGSGRPKAAVSHLRNRLRGHGFEIKTKGKADG